MTFLNAAWAIDGATVQSSLARQSVYAGTNGAEGIIQKGDLKVSALATPGQGVQIGAGGALLLNGYQTNPDQTYTVSNPAVHTMLASEMPSSNPSDKHYLVCITIGDPEFSQVGHPWMLATDPPEGEEATFEYVRPFIVPCPNGTSDASVLNLGYPALALARLEIPGGQTTIQAGYIKDVRKLAQPRSWLAISHNPAPAGTNSLNGAGGIAGTYERWPNVGVLTVDVPSWAVKAKVTGFVEGAKLTKAGYARLRAQVEGTSLVTSLTNVDETDPPNTSTDRRSYNVGGEIDVTSVAGTTKTFSVYGTPTNDASKGALYSDANTSVLLQVYFEEVPT